METKYPEPDVLRAVRKSKNNNNEVEKTNNIQQKYERSSAKKIDRQKKNRRTIRRPKPKNTRYKGKTGLKKKLISLVLAAATVASIATSAIAVEDYKDKDERIIATVQDVDGDKFENSAPAKIDWDQRKKVSSVELVDGKYYEVSPNSIVFVQEDEIRLGNKKNDVIILTEDGLVEGKMEGQYLEQTPYQLSKEAKEKYKNTYMVEAETGASLMSTPEMDSSNENTIMQIFPGEYVFGSALEKKEQNGNSLVEVLYLNENGMSHGFIEKDLLKEIDIEEEKQEETTKENVMRVETQNGIGLNCRSSAEIKENNIIEKIPSGATVSLTGKDKTDGQRNWVQIEYQNEKGKMVKGWVDNSYLKEVGKNDYYTPNITSKELKGIINSIKLNDEGRVTGIDSMGITASEIERLYNNGIEESTSYSQALKQNINISDINGHINFMYFRIGATGYGKDFSIIENDHYKEQVKKCEELGIPYGFYYYSTSTTIEEAEKEFEKIKERLDELGDLKFNLLPFGIDVELAANPENDRQYGNDVTETKAHLTNCLQNIGREVFVYTSGSATLSTTKEANILNLEKYSKLTGVKDVWMPMPIQSNGNISRAYQTYLDKFPSSMNLMMKQEVLDMSSDGVIIDLNTISKSDYILMLKSVLERVEEREKTEQQEKQSQMEYEL